MASLLRVMYAPLDYVHRQRYQSPTGTLSPALQQMVNHDLIKRYGLSTQLNFSLGSIDFSEPLITNWNLLPKVAWLLGCKLARGSLAVNGQLAALPSVARSFIALPIPCPALPSEVAVSSNGVELLGAQYLFQLQAQLPTPLAQRLPLLFASDLVETPLKLSLNRSLLTFAFDYAKNS